MRSNSYNFVKYSNSHRWWVEKFSVSRIFHLAVVLLFVSSFDSVASSQVPEGLGSGYFLPIQSVPVSAEPLDMMVCDTNLDGEQDLIVLSLDPYRFEVFLGNPGETFSTTPISSMALSSEPAGGLLIKFDQDDVFDVIVTYVDGTVDLIQGLGDGTFAPPEALLLGVGFVTSVEMADLNGDQYEDLIILTLAGFVGGGETRLMLSDGSGNYNLSSTLFPPANAAAFGDLNGDSDIDMVLAGDSVRVYSNEGIDGMVLIQETAISYVAEELILVDILQETPDGVEILDMVCIPTAGDSLVFFQGTDTGLFMDPVTGYEDEVVNALDLTVAKLDAESEGSADLLFLSNPSSATFSVLKGYGLDGIPFDGISSYSLPDDPTCLKVTDINNDGVLDAVISCVGSNSIEYFQGEPFRPDFGRGDANGDSMINLADVIEILGGFFNPGSTLPSCLDTADCNDDALLDLSDPISLLAFLFGSGDPLPPPFLGCGNDQTPDLLDCDFTIFEDPCP